MLQLRACAFFSCVLFFFSFLTFGRQWTKCVLVLLLVFAFVCFLSATRFYLVRVFIVVVFFFSFFFLESFLLFLDKSARLLSRGWLFLFVCLFDSVFLYFLSHFVFFFCRDFSLFSLSSVIYSPFLLLLLFGFVVAVISRCFSLLHTVNEVISLIYAFSRISILVLFAFSACFFCDFFLYIYILACFCCCSLVFISL